MKKARVAARAKSPRRTKRAQTSKSKGGDDEPLARLSGSQCPELDDVVDIASKESFPASDPPAYLTLHL